MYTSLVLITWIAIILLGLYVCVYALGWETNTKPHYWGLLWLMPLIGILFVFAKTSRCPDLDEITKTSTEKWHTIYKNNINADVTVATDDITLNPKKQNSQKITSSKNGRKEQTLINPADVLPKSNTVRHHSL